MWPCAVCALAMVAAASASKLSASTHSRAGSTIDYHVYEGEGHGWSKPDTVADELERSEKFLTRWVLKR